MTGADVKRQDRKEQAYEMLRRHGITDVIVLTAEEAAWGAVLAHDLPELVALLSPGAAMTTTAEAIAQIREALDRWYPDALVALDSLEAEVERLTKVESAAKVLYHFLWHEKETKSPPDELLSADCVACESSADYEREEELAMALGEALGEQP